MTPGSAARSLLLVLVPLAVYGQVVLHGWLWDDQGHLWGNVALVERGLGAFWTGVYWGLYMPVTYSVWWATMRLCRLLGLPPFPGPVFHALPVLCHLASLLIVYQILCLVLARTSVRPFVQENGKTPTWGKFQNSANFEESNFDRKTSARHVRWPACAGALLFALHPLQVEPVAWASGLKDTLAGAVTFGALWLTLRAIDRQTVPWLGTGCYVLALLSKPSAVVAPLFLMLLVAWRWPARWQPSWPLAALWLVLAGAMGLVTQYAQAVGTVPVPGVPLPARLVIAGDALWWYVRTVLWPVGLSLDYGRAPALVLASWEGWTWGLSAWGVAAVLVWWRPPWLVAVALFVAGLLPTVGLTGFRFQDLSTVADRFAYLALLGPALGLGWLLTRTPRLEVRLAVGLLLGLLGVLSAVQAHRWRDTDTLMVHVLRHHPASALAHVTRASLLVANDQHEAAERYLLAIHAAFPPSPLVVMTLGKYAAKRGAWATAARYFAAALRLREAPDLRYALARTLLPLGRLEEALVHVQAAMRTQPDWLAPYGVARFIFAQWGDQAMVQEVLAAEDKGGLSRKEVKTARFLQ